MALNRVKGPATHKKCSYIGVFRPSMKGPKSWSMAPTAMPAAKTVKCKKVLPTSNTHPSTVASIYRGRLVGEKLVQFHQRSGTCLKP